MHTILVVDDEKSIIEGYKRIFQNVKNDSSHSLLENAKNLLDVDTEGLLTKQDVNTYSLLEASSGEEAISTYRNLHTSRQPIKVVFMDVQMPPGIDGFKAATEIRKINPNVQIVYVTAFSEASLLRDDSDTNNTLILKKPYEKIEVLQIADSLTKKYDLKWTYDKFLSQVSHELKTPLVSILGFSDLLLEDKDISEENHSFLELINSSAHLLETLVNDMFTFMLLKERKMTLSKEKVELNSLFEDIYKKTLFLFNTKAETLTFEYIKDSEECFCICDKMRIEQVITNLISNAFKYTEEGQITIGFERRGQHVHLFVEDTGVGIDSAKFKVALREFERLEDYSPQPGLGLGLTISHGIISAHNGDFRIVDDLDSGNGARFEVILPVE
ncbi:MAG: hypothetical protein BM556_05495 [Bacteriovorax sp. MedPE-SWde]|nr:MAG: hypothetical protein BM556_05495 [Bacteriovorax sp. MedPE-SWde]